MDVPGLWEEASAIVAADFARRGITRWTETWSGTPALPYLEPATQIRLLYPGGGSAERCMLMEALAMAGMCCFELDDDDDEPEAE